MDFKTEVLKKSFKKPVVVDFWAPWCSPCRVLTPILEDLAETQKDRWELVKINTEEEPGLAMEYNIRSIPNVKMFYKGNVVSEFLGALPKHMILKWLAEHLPNHVMEDFKKLLDNYNQAVPDKGIIKELEPFVRKNPDFVEARILLAKHLVFLNPSKAIEVIGDAKIGVDFDEEAKDIRALWELSDFQKSDHNSAEDDLLSSKSAFISGDWEKSVHYIIESVRKDKTVQKDLPRRAGIALFRLLGHQHELTKKYRWQFNMALD